MSIDTFKTIHITEPTITYANEAAGASVVVADVDESALVPVNVPPTDVALSDTTLHTTTPVLTREQVEEDAENGRALRRGSTNEALTQHEKISILDMYEKDGLTQKEIAKRLRLNQSTVSRTLAKYSDSSRLAKKLAAARVEEALDKFMATAEAKDLLKFMKGVKLPDGTRVIEADREYATHSKSNRPDTPNVYVHGNAAIKIDQIK